MFESEDDIVKPQRLKIDKGIDLYKKLDWRLKRRANFEKYVWPDIQKMETGETCIIKLPENITVNLFLRIMKVISKKKTGKTLGGNGIKLIRTASKDAFIFLKI